MKTLSLIFLAALTAWAVPTVSHDMATRKIPNARILTGMKMFALAVAAFAAYTLLGYAGRADSYLTAGFYWMLSLHVLWSAVAGILLWYAEIWPAGDAKFFILVSASLPLVNPYLRNFPHYLFLSLLINIFVAAALWAVGSYIASGFQAASPSQFFSVLWEDSKKRFAALTEGKNKVLAAASVANLGLLFLLQQIFAIEARGFLGRFISRTDVLFFFMFMLWDKIGGVFANRRWLYISAASYAVYFISGFFLFPGHLWTLAVAAAANVVKFSLLLFVGRFMLEFLMEKKDIQHLTARELEPGVVLSAKAARMLKDNPVFEGAFDDCFRDGLTKEQVEELRGWMGKLNVHDPKIETVRGRPFALWIFAGAVISLVLDGTVTRLLR